MTRFVLCAACLAVLLTAATPAPAQTPALTNDDIIALAAADLGDALIVATVRGAEAVDFDLGPAGLIGLKTEGISDDVLAAMIARNVVGTSGAGTAPESRDPVPAIADSSPSGTSEPAPGIYLLRLNGTRTPLEPTNFSAGSGSRWRSRLTFGFGKDQSKALVPNERAVIRTTQQRPKFLFVLPASDHGRSLEYAGGGSWFTGFAAGMSSPNQFALAQFLEEGNRRELVVGETNDFGVSSGPDTDALVPFTFERREPGVYEVTPLEDLGLGEFCFFPLGTGGGGTSAGYGGPGANTLFDFGVDPPDPR